MGFKQVFCTPDSRHNFSEENFKKLEKEIGKIYQYFLTCICCYNFIPLNINIFENYLYKALFVPTLKEKQDNLEIYRCGLGTCGASIGPHGDIFACQE